MLKDQTFSKHKGRVKDVVNRATCLAKGVTSFPVCAARVGVGLNIAERQGQVLGTSAEQMPHGSGSWTLKTAKDGIREDDFGVIASAHACRVTGLEAIIELLNELSVRMHECFLLEERPNVGISRAEPKAKRRLHAVLGGALRNGWIT